MIIYQPNASLDASASEFGRLSRDILWAGSGRSKHQAYLNYAHGDETLEELYGHEPWRLQKLRRLKEEYDPEGRFNFYAPIS